MITPKQQLHKALLSLGYDKELISISKAPQKQMGDYATALAMRIAKAENRAPLEVAEQIKQDLVAKGLLKDIVEKIKVVKPGFINFFLHTDYIQRELAIVQAAGETFGAQEVGSGKTVIVEYSSPNIAKQMHVGHLRSTIIGQSLARLFEMLGYTVIRDNHLGDWGTGFGKLIAAYRNKYGDNLEQKLSIADMEQLYVEFSQAAKADDTLQAQARSELKKLQDGDEFHVALWQLFRQKSLEELTETIYNPLGVTFDTNYGEAFYYTLPAVEQVYGEKSSVYVDDVVKELEKKGIAKESEGALIVPSTDEQQPPMLIQKQDGAYLYATSDLATVKLREERYHPFVVLYVVAYQQELHFKQVISVAEKVGYARPGTLEHISFGLVLGGDGKKMSTREGNAVSAADILQKSIAEAEKIVQEKNPDLSADEQKRIAQVVGLGALKYNDLSRDRMTDITFDWEAMMQLSGGSAPYLQYTYARIQSIIKKSKGVPKQYDVEKLCEADEIELLKLLLQFPDVLIEAHDLYKPNTIALYLEQLAAAFHKYYEHVQILTDNEAQQAARLNLIAAISVVMKNGLYVLGVDVLERI